jgi:hypothetical protein
MSACLFQRQHATRCILFLGTFKHTKAWCYLHPISKPPYHRFILTPHCIQSYATQYNTDYILCCTAAVGDVDVNTGQNIFMFRMFDQFCTV